MKKERLSDNVKYVMTKLLIRILGEQVEEQDGPEALNKKFPYIVEFAEGYVDLVEQTLGVLDEPRLGPVETKRLNRGKLKSGISLTNTKRT